MGKKQEGFEQYYSELYQDRWEALRQALLKEATTLSLSDELFSPYFLDPASLVSACNLPVNEGDNVLDMCAAPGGKTLCLALKLKGTGSLTSNDRSQARRMRLKNSIEQCLRPEWRSNIMITGFDAVSWGVYEKDAYDAILLDAPCSSERHVLSDQGELDQWGPSRPKRLASQQYGMLCSAMLAVKPQGFIMYSTCSINSIENEGVIQRYMDRHDNAQVIDLCLYEDPRLSLERRPYGQIILPDASNGFGPIYTCLMRRTK